MRKLQYSILIVLISTVYSQNKNIYGMMHMYETLTDSKCIEVRFCDSIVDAENWILGKNE